MNQFCRVFVTHVCEIIALLRPSIVMYFERELLRHSHAQFNDIISLKYTFHIFKVRLILAYFSLLHCKLLRNDLFIPHYELHDPFRFLAVNDLGLCTIETLNHL